ncbi:phosphoenolpyruvate carboxykinase [ATP] 2 [Portibacter lacus]|uniref:Phosphoenolpyruvate carboxykinase (ATP) n=2 Tax=Portibacter lacus TaxID=1099794 RepID=A0AA37SNH6_9BACT|nr:phosphoenolpyruvate carboxykinase [ATP] 2 [Portibacter lacus]
MTRIKNNLFPAALVEESIKKDQGKLSSSGALVVNTGKFTGRSPKDRFIVKDEITTDVVDWGEINIPISEKHYDELFEKTMKYMDGLDAIYTRDAHACANPNYKLKVRVHAEFPWQSMFAYNMFLRPSTKELIGFQADWNVYAFPGVEADPKVNGTRQNNYSIINFTKRVIIIGGTAYTGEIKKGIFSALNFILPVEHNVLPMHCSANVGTQGDTALFFGLSGTGKTTLSNDPDRRLIGDDEHGWSNSSVFNFEGGCYAKTIDLSASKEPQIWSAIKFGALLENVGFKEDGRTVDYEDVSLTQNTRVSYPIYHIDNIMYNSRGDLPENIFFLTCDAFGVLPPISKLTKEQAMYHFISGYTAKIAGTEEGIVEPQATFSACFGAPFLPLHPTKYADLLGAKIEKGTDSGEGTIDVWLINTGWTGGPYGEGSRMELAFTRSMIKAALTGKLVSVEYQTMPIFNLQIPKTCPDVPNAILNPRDTWRNEEEFDKQAKNLAARFEKNFQKYAAQASKEIVAAGPEI